MKTDRTDRTDLAEPSSPLTSLGDADAEICAGGWCEVPPAPGTADE
jgi:hypothetical protein